MSMAGSLWKTGVTALLFVCLFVCCCLFCLFFFSFCFVSSQYKKNQRVFCTTETASIETCAVIFSSTAIKSRTDDKAVSLLCVFSLIGGSTRNGTHIIFFQVSNTFYLN